MVRMNQHFLAPPFMKPMLLMVSQPLRMICKTGEVSTVRGSKRVRRRSTLAFRSGQQSPEKFLRERFSGKVVQRDIRGWGVGGWEA